MDGAVSLPVSTPEPLYRHETEGPVKIRGERERGSEKERERRRKKERSMPNVPVHTCMYHTHARY